MCFKKWSMTFHKLSSSLMHLATLVPLLQINFLSNNIWWGNQILAWLWRRVHLLLSTKLSLQMIPTPTNSSLHPHVFSSIFLLAGQYNTIMIQFYNLWAVPSYSIFSPIVNGVCHFLTGLDVKSDFISRTQLVCYKNS